MLDVYTCLNVSEWLVHKYTYICQLYYNTNLSFNVNVYNTPQHSQHFFIRFLQYKLTVDVNVIISKLTTFFNRLVF